MAEREGRSREREEERGGERTERIKKNKPGMGVEWSGRRVLRERWRRKGKGRSRENEKGREEDRR